MMNSTELREVAAKYSLTWPEQYLALADDGWLDVRAGGGDGDGPGVPRHQLLHFDTDFEVLSPKDIDRRLAMLADPDDFRGIDSSLLPFGMEPGGNLYCFHMSAADGDAVPVVLLQNDDDEDLRLAPDLAGFVFTRMVETATEFYDDDYLGEGDPKQNADDWLHSHERILKREQVALLRDIFARPLIERDNDSMGFIEWDDVDDLIDSVLDYPERHEPMQLWDRG